MAPVQLTANVMYDLLGIERLFILCGRLDRLALVVPSDILTVFRAFGEILSVSS